MARLAIAHSDDLEANKLASIKTQISQALRVKEPKSLSDDLVDGILNATEAVLKEEGKERHVKRVKRNIQAAFERLESRDLHPVTSGKEDLLVKRLGVDLAQGEEIVFSRCDKMQSSKAKATVDQFLSDWLANSEPRPNLIFVVTDFNNGFRQLKDLLALSHEKPVQKALETLKICCKQKKLQFWVEASFSYFFPVAVMDPAISEERGYIFYKGEQGTCIPLNMASCDVRDWSNHLYMPMLKANDCLDMDLVFEYLGQGPQGTVSKQTEKTDSSSPLDIIAKAQLG